MTLDPRSRERLRDLGRQLPQQLPTPSSNRTNQKQEDKRHRIETEEDPTILFQELMKASPDGTVPSHLLKRLKEIESKELSPNTQEIDNQNNNPAKRNTSMKNTIKDKSDDKNLYTTFQRLLLEEDEL